MCATSYQIHSIHIFLEAVMPWVRAQLDADRSGYRTGKVRGMAAADRTMALWIACQGVHYDPKDMPKQISSAHRAQFNADTWQRQVEAQNIDPN